MARRRIQGHSVTLNVNGLDLSQHIQSLDLSAFQPEVGGRIFEGLKQMGPITISGVYDDRPACPACGLRFMPSSITPTAHAIDQDGRARPRADVRCVRRAATDRVAR